MLELESISESLCWVKVSPDGIGSWKRQLNQALSSLNSPFMAALIPDEKDNIAQIIFR